MYNEIDFLVKKAALEDMQREAQRSRLVREVLEGQQGDRVYHPEKLNLWRLYSQSLVKIGGLLARIGQNLQTRYAEPISQLANCE